MVRLALNGLALVLITIIALYFGRASSILAAAPEPTMAQMIRELPPPVKGAARAAPSASDGACRDPESRHAVPRPVSLSAAAELCGDLARILDGRDVQALLERTAILLDAKGLMIWLVDTGGAILRPSMCHGYPDKVLRGFDHCKSTVITSRPSHSVRCRHKHCPGIRQRMREPLRCRSSRQPVASAFWPPKFVQASRIRTCSPSHGLSPPNSRHSSRPSTTPSTPPHGADTPRCALLFRIPVHRRGRTRTGESRCLTEAAFDFQSAGCPAATPRPCRAGGVRQR